MAAKPPTTHPWRNGKAQQEPMPAPNNPAAQPPNSEDPSRGRGRAGKAPAIDYVQQAFALAAARFQHHRILVQYWSINPFIQQYLCGALSEDKTCIDYNHSFRILSVDNLLIIDGDYGFCAWRLQHPNLLKWAEAAAQDIHYFCEKIPENIEVKERKARSRKLGDGGPTQFYPFTQHQLMRVAAVKWFLENRNLRHKFFIPTDWTHDDPRLKGVPDITSGPYHA